MFCACFVISLLGLSPSFVPGIPLVIFSLSSLMNGRTLAYFFKKLLHYSHMSYFPTHFPLSDINQLQLILMNVCLSTFASTVRRSTG
jgi:hypothetical protein